MGCGIRKRKRLKKLCEQQEWQCWICGHPMLKPDKDKGPSNYTATIDHIVPKNKHGEQHPRAVLAAHKWCNGSRHHDHGNTVKKIKKIMDRKFSNHNWVRSLFSIENQSAWRQNATNQDKPFSKGNPMSQSLLEKAEALASRLGTDVETIFAEFENWVEGKKAAEAPKEAEQAGETSIASTDSTSNTIETTTTEPSTPDTASEAVAEPTPEVVSEVPADPKTE